MIQKIKLFLLTAAVALSTVSCLEKFPEDAILEKDVMKSLSDADQAVVGIYAAFKSSALYSGALTLCPDIQADLVYAVDGFSNTYGDIWRWEINGTNPTVESVYAALYTVIGKCNFFMDKVGALRESLTSDDDLDQLQYYEGEVRFARALCYSELIKLFCKAYPEGETAAERDGLAKKELGVALVTSYLHPEHPKRASLYDSYDFVLKELEKAAEYIVLEKTNNSPYFNRSLVYALYARIYLYMRDWDKAIEYSSKVIDDDTLVLSSVNTQQTASQSSYEYMWSNDAATEIIWKVGFTTTSYGGALGRVFLNYDYRSYRPDYVPAAWALDLYDSTDKRFDAFFAPLTTGYAHGLTWPLLVKYYGNETLRANRILHVSAPKVFRLSEQYLIRAEAYCEKGAYGTAAKDITVLRSARYEKYGSTSLTEANWRQTISDERVRELYMEGFRLQDLKRWHQGFTRTPQQNTVAGSNASSLKIEADDPLFVWPIPQHELDAPGSDIEPNESNK